MLICIVFSVTLLANDTFKGTAKQDVNVRTLPDYDSKIAYVLRKDQDVNIEVLVKTKNKGSWYKIEKGYVATRFVATNSANIPNKTLEELNKLTKEITSETPKKVEVQVVQQLNDSKEDKPTAETQTPKEKPKQDTAESIEKTVEVKDKIQEPTFIEPTVIRKDENKTSENFNFEYILYVLLGLVLPIILIVLIKKIFSKPSISDQIDQHKKRSDSLKKALKATEEKPVDKE